MSANPTTDSPSIVWFRRDLRLEDNLALAAAIDRGGTVFCIYIREDQLAGALGAAQAWWVHHSLLALREDLEARGNHLILLSGTPSDVLEDVVRKTGAGAIFWNRRYDPDGIQTDSRLKSAFREKGLKVESFAGSLLHEPTRLKTKQGKHFSVFTPFWRALSHDFEPLDTLPAPKTIPAAEHSIRSESLDGWKLLPEKPNWASSFSETWQPGEAGALERLEHFMDGRLSDYQEGRDYPAKTSVSGLSPHLAMGEISPHRIWRELSRHARALSAEGATAFRRELAWRDFAWHLLFHRPDMRSVNMDRRFDAFGWKTDKQGLERWQKGQTGYPVVDAGMRELWATGIMHNRVRMIAASFLIKDLLIDWRQGESWFRDTLVDADHASNAMNWQWVAGCGADASPWFRIFNPVKQGETFDPDGAYVHRWCPELSKLPAKWLHHPFDAPEKLLGDLDLKLGTDYAKPLIAHDFARDRALAAFKAIRQDTQT